MSETKTSTPRPETQRERWMKYGANVALVCLVAIVLAGLVTALAQMADRRIDTTRAGLYSLKPQTINLIKDNKQPIKIYSLYTHPRPGMDSADQPAQDYAGPVADLLEEYKSKGSHIDVEVIDPLDQPTKVDQLISEVTSKYGGEIKQYKAIIDEYPGVYDQITKLAGEEAKKVKAALSKDNQINADEDLGQTLLLTIATVQGFPKFLENTKEGVDKRLKLKPPDYKGAVNSVESGMSTLSQLADRIISDFGKGKDDKKVPEAIRKYMAESAPRYEQIKKLADGLLDKIKKLGELKLDSLRQSLREKDAVLVMGENDMKVLPFEKVWQVPDDIRGFTPDGRPKPRFAGEQQISSAILALTAKSKPKVCFVRPGGAPLTNPGIPGFQAGGPLSAIADRLREYNFDVMEKDLTGMYAMQAQMQGQQAAPEPTDEQIKDAVWIVLDIPAGRSPMGPPPSIADKVRAHMAAGGSAMILTMPQTDNLASVLDDWGVKIRTDAVIVHELVKSGAGQAGDMIDRAERNPLIFVLKHYGDHPLVRPLASLESVLVPMAPVETQQKPGYKASPLLPIPTSLKTWGETNVDAALNKPDEVAYHDGDIKPPLYAGSAVEKDGAGRLVVIGSIQFILNDMLSIPDEKLAQQGVYVSRFPGNAELFMNSVFWLSRMDTMIAISPAAMEVSRIGDMSSGVQNAWRVGVVLIGLPLLAIMAGIMVYAARRD